MNIKALLLSTSTRPGLSKINAWRLTRRSCYFVLHYLYLSYVNPGLPPDHLSAGPSVAPAMLGLAASKQSGSGLREAPHLKIVVEGPIRHVGPEAYVFICFFVLVTQV